ncbi:MAG: hypothetical protein J0647_01490 [Campylobacteraceae bacterium]|nr:hypothetical protein [Campylobacteraceae bacterium]
MKIQIESHQQNPQQQEQDNGVLEDLFKDLLKNGIEAILENGIVSLKMPLELFAELGLDSILDKGMER